VRKISMVFGFLLLSLAASAQIPKGNVFIGYSYNRADLNGGGHANLNGWDGSLEGKVLPWVGIVADLSGHYGSPSGVSTKEYNFLFGPRVSVSVGKIRPFAHFLFGASHITGSASGVSLSDTSFGTALGGGVDYKLLTAVGWRVQLDYLQTRFFSHTQNDFRFATGLVLNF